MKLLLDEDLSPWAARQLREVDHLDACSVRDRSLLNAADHVVMDYAYRDDRILVTANVRDFLKLARVREIHPGIVLLEEGNLGRAEQLARVRLAVAEIRKEGDVTNKVLTVKEDGSVSVEVIPPEP